jgi:peptidoglycan/LPS O-acetylase OafA/YrhL
VVPRSPEGHGLRYAPGLDGVRALAVFAVVAYHIGTTSASTVLPGGFLGVDVFFVLSGYLITSLLIVEVQQTGRISIKNFYIRRARRLLPALFALLLVVAAIGAFWLPQQAARLKGDLLASLGYVTNWWLIAENSSYFATAGDRPPMLTHLWSLAVEEQYYLVWPLILVAFAAVRARRGLMLTIVGAGIIGSMVVGYLLYDPFSDPSRVYYGTDTRALAPLLGAFLAIAVKPWHHRTRLPRGARHGLDFLGVTALLALAAIAAILDDTDESLYRGGFLVIAVLGGVVVTVAGHPGTALGEALGTQPLRYLGERSYAIYLWHWPVCLLTRPGLDVPLTGWANAALRIAISILLAEISYQLIEKPIRKHGFLAPLRRTKAPRPGHRPSPRPDQPAIGRATVGRARVTPSGAYAQVAASGAYPQVTVRSSAAPPAEPEPARRQRAPIVRTAVLTIAMITGGSWVGVKLTDAASQPVAGGPVDLSADQSLGPLATASASPSVAAVPRAPLAPGSTVAFFGDSQGMTLVLNQPADLSQYINAVDATIAGCGILLGKVESSTGERRNLTANCANWRSAWTSRAEQHEPAVAVIVLGAWDVFDLTLDSGQKLVFGSQDWDHNFSVVLAEAITTLRSPQTEVAISLLPCYRPIEGSAGFWPERGDDDRTRHVNELITASAAAYPSGVITLEPPAEFCTDPVIGTGTAYRWDGVHYYKKGAALYFSAILPQLLNT